MVKHSAHIYTVDEIADLVRPIAERYGVASVMLFGSYARGDADRNSDIDLYIEAGEISDLIELSGFRLDLIETLCKEVDVMTADDLSAVKSIIKNGVSIYG
ncbi:MAG: nucleotidyltransferase domain-containing protein [Methanomassiliicoccaceae archaeon]|nr:nucleotidyltransferase domain-containing protein [Methanomassiliicoccaceae archaeon]